MNTQVPIWFASLVVAGFILITGVAVSSKATDTFGSAGSGQAGIATSSTLSVGGDIETTIFSANQYCAHRVIDTAGAALALSFQTNVVPDPVVGAPVGLLVASSSSLSLDSDLYGCGTVTALGTATSTITRTEFSQ